MTHRILLAFILGVCSGGLASVGLLAIMMSEPAVALLAHSGAVMAAGLAGLLTRQADKPCINSALTGPRADRYSPGRSSVSGSPRSACVAHESRLRAAFVCPDESTRDETRGRRRMTALVLGWSLAGAVYGLVTGDIVLAAIWAAAAAVYVALLLYMRRSRYCALCGLALYPGGSHEQRDRGTVCGFCAIQLDRDERDAFVASLRDGTWRDAGGRQ